MKRKYRITVGFKKFLREMLPVLAGVFLALILNNWQQNRQDRKFLQKTLASIAQEVKDNRKELKEKIQEREELLSSLKTQAAVDSISLEQIVREAGGIKFAYIKNSGWKALLNRNITLTEYEVISCLTEIDAGKELMQRQADLLGEVFYDSYETPSEINKAKAWAILNDIYYCEVNLLDSHEEFLKLMRQKE